MIRTNLLETTESRKVTAEKGVFSVLEYDRDLSVSPDSAQKAYYASRMNVRKRQLIARLSEENAVRIQAGRMQMMVGTVRAVTDIRSAGKFLKQLAGAAVTKETAVKPVYSGEGYLVLEPTYNYILLEDLEDWENEMVIEDGMFLACDDTVQLSVTARANLSSAVFGGEGLFNTTMLGPGVVALESPVPADELFVLELEDDEVRIDGGMAIAWSYGLKFTVERTTPTLIGSAVSKEGLVNVYRGTGRILVAPVDKNRNISYPNVTP